MTISAAQAGRRRAIWRIVFWPTFATVFAFVVLAGLGFWQLDRLAWKEGLIEQVNSRLGLSPVDAPGPSEWTNFDVEFWDFRPVAVSGHFLPGEAYYYIAVTEPKGAFGGPGYFLYAPFLTDAGFAVMVNRGFVPDGKRLPESRPGSAAPLGPLTLTGLLRRAEVPNFLSVAPDLVKNMWFVREPIRMAESLGVAGVDVAPYAIDLTAEATPPGGLPQAGETIVSFRNNHLQYAVTWFGLALVLLGVYVAFLRSRLKAYQAK